jgi:hypothetical protein
MIYVEALLLHLPSNPMHPICLSFPCSIAMTSDSIQMLGAFGSTCVMNIVHFPFTPTQWARSSIILVYRFNQMFISNLNPSPLASFAQSQVYVDRLEKMDLQESAAVVESYRGHDCLRALHSLHSLRTSPIKFPTLALGLSDSEQCIFRLPRHWRMSWKELEHSMHYCLLHMETFLTWFSR